MLSLRRHGHLTISTCKVHCGEPLSSRNHQSGARDTRLSSSGRSVYDNLRRTVLFHLSWLLRPREMPKGYHWAQFVPPSSISFTHVCSFLSPAGANRLGPHRTGRASIVMISCQTVLVRPVTGSPGAGKNMLVTRQQVSQKFSACVTQ